jgi:hypothetical protein
MASFLVGQDAASSSKAGWSGLLVAASCQAQSSGQSEMPRKTATTTREQNTTYEQTQHQADRSKTGRVRDDMARTTDRGTSVDKSEDPLARTTTPPIDDKGTRGKATIANTAANDAANLSGGNSTASVKEGSDADLAKGMDASCRISQATSAFALRLDDGSMVKFDDASNSKIAQQLQSGDRLQHKSKIFRANIKGSLKGGAISADSIQM